jgi:hypothetical protein
MDSNNWSIEQARKRINSPLPVQDYNGLASAIRNLQDDTVNLLALVDRLQAVCTEQAETIKRNARIETVLKKIAREATEADNENVWLNMNEIKRLATNALEQEGSKV